MPYILYSLKTDRAKYLSASTVSAEGARTRMAAAHYARIPAVNELALSQVRQRFLALGSAHPRKRKNIHLAINKRFTKRTYTNLYELIIKYRCQFSIS